MIYIRLFKKFSLRNTSLINSITNKHDIVKFISTVNQNDARQKKIDEKYSYLKDYKCVYRLNNINILTTLSRLKIYQSIFTCALGIATTSMYFVTSTISLTSLLMTNGASIISLLTLAWLSKYLVKIICALYLHSNGTDIIISHVNFFSRRSNIFTSVDNVKPIINSISDLDSSQLKNRFELNDSNGSMYYSLKFGKILDEKNFKKAIRII